MEKDNLSHPLYKKLEKLHKEYRESLLKERESEIYDKHKRK